MKGSSKYKKRLIITGITLGAILLLSLVAMKLGKNALRKHHISYQSLDFHFPSSLSVRDLRIASSESFNLEVALLEVEWSWGSLFKGAPKLKHLYVEQGTLKGSSVEEDPQEEDSLAEDPQERKKKWPRISLEDMELKDLSVDYISEQDTLLFHLSGLRLNVASLGDQIKVDSLFLKDPILLYTTSGDESSTDSGSNFSLEGIPQVALNYLNLSGGDFLMQSPGNVQHLEEIDLIFSGAKNSSLANFTIKRLGFVYQDTLDMQLVLENGALNDTFQTDFRNLEMRIPGISVHLSEALVNLGSGPELALTLAESYLTVGRIRQFLPGIATNFHPDLPNETRIHLKGDLAFADQTFFLDSFTVGLLDSTSMELSGAVHLSDKTLIDLEINPFKSTRSNLVSILAEANYHRFYIWPTGINGAIRITGNPDDLLFRGNFKSDQGPLKAETIVKNDSLNGLFFSLDIQSDSIKVDQVSSLHPFPVPHGQLHFYLEFYEGEYRASNPLLIRITSDHLFAFDQYIHNLEFVYYEDETLDSMHVSVDDLPLKLKVAMVTPAEGDGRTVFEGRLDQFTPRQFIPSWSEGTISTHLNGHYLLSENEYHVSLGLSSSALSTSDETVAFSDSRISLDGEEDRLTLELEAGDLPLIIARTGSSFPPFALPLPDWFALWPETEVALQMKLDETVFAFLTGATGSVAIDHLKLVKDSTSWNANLLVPDFTFGSNHMDSIAFDLSSMGEILEGKLEISRLSNASISLEGITAILRYSDHCYGFDLENSYSELIGANHISLLAQEVDGGYKLSFNESDPLVIKDESWSLTKNQGLAIDKNFKLLEGDLAISNGPSTLEAMTENHIVRLMIDSLNLDPWFAYLTREDLISGQLNGEIELNTLDRITQWDADIVASNEWVPEPVFVAISGKMSQDGFSAHLDISQDDLSAQANVRKTGDEVDYAAVLNRVDLGLLHLLPAWPGDFDVSGRISGKAWGSIGTTISNRGYLVTEEVVLKPPLTYSPIRLEHDTLMLKDSLILLKDFRIKDYLDEELLVAGSLQYSPDLKFDLSLKSEQFALLQSGENESQIQGELNLSADLHLEGGREEVLISGQLSTLPGANIKYTTQATFNLVDASQVVTFMELDAEDSEHKEVPSEKIKAITKLNWDVNLLVNPASIEIMLDEISQEFIQINSEGQLSIRSGFDEKPMVYGSIASTSGRAFIRPPAIPEVDLIIDNALIKWNGLVDDPTMSFRGYKIVKGPTGGLSPQFENRSEFINYKVYVVLDRVRLSDFNLRFDLEAEDSEAEILLASLPADTRQAYALNMLLFGKVGTDKISGKAMVADQVTTKLNELARRNFKNTGLSFSSSYYKNAKDGVVERSHTDLNYALSRGFLNNKLSFSVMGSVGFYMDDLTMLPPSNLIGDVELRYILSEKPKLTLKGARENVYEGIIDGMVTEESVGLIYQKSYPTFIDLFRKNKINLAK